MKVKFIFDAQFAGRAENIVELPSETTEDEIKALFPEHIGVVFDDNCNYEIVPDDYLEEDSSLTTIPSLESEILELTKKIALKEKDLNTLKLCEVKLHRIGFYIPMDNKKRKMAISKMELLFNIKFKGKKQLFNVKSAEYTKCSHKGFIQKIEIDKHGIFINFIGALADMVIKDCLSKIMSVIKGIHNDFAIGVTGTEGIFVPEIDNGGFYIRKIKE